MSALVLPIFALLVGFVGLVWSADRFVDGSAAIARAAGLSPLVIGLTIVSFGTSAPEVLVSLNAALEGAGELAIGNALGSNLANIGLVLGVTALVARLPVQRHLLLHEWPVLLAVTLLAGVFLFDGLLAVWEGALLLMVLAPAVAYLVIVKKKTLSPLEAAEETNLPRLAPRVAAFWFVVGLMALVLSARVLVWGATQAALFFEVSPLLIGLTVVALGTSLPELAASVASALKGHHDIALGNVIGSNMFNLLAVMAIPALFAPLALPAEVFQRDYLAMAASTLLLFGFTAVSLWRHRGSSRAGLGRAAGVLLLAVYAVYYYLLF